MEEGWARAYLLLAVAYPLALTIPRSPWWAGYIWLGQGAMLVAASIAAAAVIASPRVSPRRGLALAPLAYAACYALLDAALRGRVSGPAWVIRGAAAGAELGLYGAYLLCLAAMSPGVGRQLCAAAAYSLALSVSFLADVARPFAPGPLEPLALATAYIACIACRLAGVRCELAAGSGGPVLIASWLGRSAVVVVGWPCAGATWLALYAALCLAFAPPSGRGVIALVAGGILMFLANSARVAGVIGVSLALGVDAAEAFHSLWSEIVMAMAAWCCLWLARKKAGDKDRVASKKRLSAKNRRWERLTSA